MFPSVGSSEKGQGDVANTYGDERLTLVNTIHLECPPGEFFEVHQVRTIVDSRFRQFLEAAESYKKGAGWYLEYLWRQRLTLGNIMHLERPCHGFTWLHGPTGAGKSAIALFFASMRPASSSMECFG